MSTAQNIIDAARDLFAEKGFAATSMREIVARADANIAAVNYHFGSKQALFFAILEEPLAHLKARRLQRLDAVLEKADWDTRDVVDAFLLPLLDESDHGPNAFVFGPMLARVFHEMPELKEVVFKRFFKTTVMRFTQALQTRFPEAPPSEVSWALYLMVSAMVGSLASRGPFPPRSVDSKREREQFIDRIAEFSAAGIDAHLGRFGDTP